MTYEESIGKKVEVFFTDSFHEDNVSPKRGELISADNKSLFIDQDHGPKIHINTDLIIRVVEKDG